jgi:hypothetical protein
MQEKNASFPSVFNAFSVVENFRAQPQIFSSFCRFFVEIASNCGLFPDSGSASTGMVLVLHPEHADYLPHRRQALFSGLILCQSPEVLRHIVVAVRFPVLYQLH